MGVTIVTDTACDLPADVEAEVRAAGVHFVPHIFRFGREEHRDKSMPMAEFVARAYRIWPQTTVPSPGAFGQVFQRITDAGNQVLCITVTGRHSGTCSAAETAAQQFPAGQVTVFDSQSLSVGQALIVQAAARVAGAGGSLDEVLAAARDVQARLHLFMTVDTLDYLVRGGRASRLGGVVAGLLKIRPIMSMRDGEMILLAKPRGRQSAKRELLALATACLPAEQVAVGHIMCEFEGEELRAALSASAGAPGQISLAETGMVLAAHGGPGTLGIAIVSR